MNEYGTLSSNKKIKGYAIVGLGSLAMPMNIDAYIVQ